MNKLLIINNYFHENNIIYANCEEIKNKQYNFYLNQLKKY